MPFFLLHHQHEAHECAAVFAAWQGFESPPDAAACGRAASGGHGLWWQVTAPSHREALALLPRFVAQRTNAIQVREVEIP